MTDFERTLTEVTTGTTAAQVERGGARVTVIVEQDAEAALHGQALRALRPVPVFVDAAPWAPVFGPVFTVPGGTELVIDDDGLAALREEHAPDVIPTSALVPVVLADGAFPSIPALIRFASIGTDLEITPRGTGPHVAATPAPCDHRRVDHLCRACLASWWRARAQFLGLEITP
jgi:hypothetical protein